MKKIVLMSMLVFIVGSLLAQQKTYVGLDLAFSNKKFLSPEHELETYSGTNSVGPFLFNLRQDVYDNFSIETGLIYTDLSNDYYSILIDSSSPSTHGFRKQVNISHGSNWQVPLRLISKIPLYKNLYFTSQIGCHFIINSRKLKLEENISDTEYVTIQNFSGDGSIISTTTDTVDYSISLNSIAANKYTMSL